ncbi:MAG TPA: DUF1624 domain-containing protein [Candidatus Poseidoniales archaeon]|jgi:uncharacterized membrane protein|nr:DUF1624 domain-containing protein [Candidatus Poseidoniales archaeon]HIL64962.1 DUF1624 domain-containing protein [Candidatus Poseidoniales archaeon]
MVRDLRIDFLRSIAILFMVEVHIAATIAPENIAKGSSLGLLSASIGGLAAPLFVMIAGWGAAKSSNNGIWLRFSFLMLAQLLVNLIASHVFNWYTPGILSLLAVCGLVSPMLRRINARNLKISFAFLLVLPFFLYRIDGTWTSVITADGIIEWLKLLLIDGTYPLIPWLAFFVLGFIVAQNQQKHILATTSILSLIIALYALEKNLAWALTSGDALLTFFPASSFFIINATFGILLLHSLLAKLKDEFFSSTVSLSFARTGKLSLTIYILHFIPIRYLDLIDYHGSTITLTFVLILVYCLVWWVFSHLQSKYFSKFSAEHLLKFLSDKYNPVTD